MDNEFDIRNQNREYLMVDDAEELEDDDEDFDDDIEDEDEEDDEEDDEY